MNVLDKEEFRVKLEEINRLVEKKDYKGAMSVVDSIDWRRVKNVRTLCVVGEIYAANKRYEDSKEIFLLAYHRSSIGKNILYRLIEVSLKMGNVDEAMEFFEEYLEVAPGDNTQYILKYKIYKAKKASLEELISILEEYKKKEFTEKWSYELANLYYQAGEKEKCLDLCNEMVVWFNDGKYVMKALDLKLRLGSLTGEEKEKYEKQFVPSLKTPEDMEDMEDTDEDKKEPASVSEEEGPRIESIRMDEKDINNAESLQEKISKGIRDIFGNKKQDKEESAEEAAAAEEKIQEEMIKDISAKLDYVDVPDLEPEGEKASPVKPVKANSEEKKDLSQTMKMPELKIPKSMKNMNPDQQEIPQAPNVKGIALADEIMSDDDKEFNLEDTILAAATAQGIEIPKETINAEMIPDEESKESKEQEEEIPEVTEESEEPEEEISEETEESEEPEEEISEASEKPEEPKIEFVSDEEDEDDDEMPELEDMIPEEKEPKKTYEVPSLEEEEFLTEEDLREAEEEFLNGPAFRDQKKARYPEGMNTEMFNFQEEIKKVLGKNQDLFSETEEEEETLDQISFPEEEEPEEEENLSEEEELEKFIDSMEPEKNPYEIIPRERSLTEDEMKLFTYFVRVPGMKDQLLDTLADVQMAASDKTSRTGNIIVMGGKETGKTRLISSLIPAICKELHLSATKVAYVFAEEINGKDMSKIVSKLAGGFLVIENANQLSQETAEQLNKAMEFRTDGLIVIVEDEKIGMRKFIARYPKLAKKFTSEINIPVFTNDELVAFAKVYTKENGYTIDQMGMLALYNLISNNQKADEAMNIGAVKNLIDAAIAKSQGGIRKLQRNISKKRTDHDGFIVLYEKDFS